MVPETRVKRGQSVKCELTGIEGLVSALAVEDNGNIRVGIQPRSTDNSKLAESFFTDENSVHVLGEGISAKAVPPQETHIQIKHQVRDRISGFYGTVTTMVWYLNGCVHAVVTGPYLERGRPVTHDFNVTRLTAELVTPSEQPTSERPPGGPISTAYARR